MYVFALCAADAGAALKREVERRRLGWSPSYQRPGFVTFKGARAGALPALTWARERSFSLGKLAAPWSREAIDALTGPGGDEPVVLRVSPREESLAPVAEALASDLGVSAPAEPRTGDRVIELVVVAPDELWVGEHLHDDSHARQPGGVWPTVVPEHAPSRAWAKLEAIVDRWGIAPGVGQHVLELGSAPGGTAWALLERGALVTGVDPGSMDPRVLAHPNFRHVAGSISVLPLDALPRRVDWLLSDMNVTPRLTLRCARRLLVLEPSTLVLTLKLKDWALADRVPSWLDLVRSWGFDEVWAQQLWPHRQELAIAARR